MSIEQQNPELKKLNSLHTKCCRNDKIIIEHKKENNHLPERHLHEKCHREKKKQVNEFWKLSFVEQEKDNIKYYRKHKDPSAFQMIPENV